MTKVTGNQGNSNEEKMPFFFYQIDEEEKAWVGVDGGGKPRSRFGCGEAATLIYSWAEWKLVQFLGPQLGNMTQSF